jgi:hypothetical protein
MSINIITRTNRSVFGNRQERVVVVGGGDCDVHALAHCASRRPATWGPAWQSFRERLLKAAFATFGYRPALAGLPTAGMFGAAMQRPALARSTATS